MAEADGLLVDLRDMPRGVQEIAFEKGMIPCIPADRERGPGERAERPHRDRGRRVLAAAALTGRAQAADEVDVFSRRHGLDTADGIARRGRDGDPAAVVWMGRSDRWEVDLVMIARCVAEQGQGAEELGKPDQVARCRPPHPKGGIPLPHSLPPPWVLCLGKSNAVAGSAGGVQCRARARVRREWNPTLEL
jgi:hypothetical protein